MQQEQNGVVYPAVAKTRKLYCSPLSLSPLFTYVCLLVCCFLSVFFWQRCCVPMVFLSILLLNCPSSSRAQWSTYTFLTFKYSWVFGVIDRWCFYCSSSATDTKNISGVRLL